MQTRPGLSRLGPSKQGLARVGKSGISPRILRPSRVTKSRLLAGGGSSALWNKLGQASPGIHTGNVSLGRTPPNKKYPQAGIGGGKNAQRDRNVNSRVILMVTSRRTIVGRFADREGHNVRGVVGAKLATRYRSDFRVALADREFWQKIAKGKIANAYHKDEHYLAVEKHFDEALSAAKVHQGTKIMIGKHSEGSAWRKFGYDNAAQKSGAKHFEMAKESWKSLSNFRKWRRNAEFLRDGVHQNARFYLATPTKYASGWYKREIEFLQRRGYVYSQDGLYMFKPE